MLDWVKGDDFWFQNLGVHKTQLFEKLWFLKELKGFHVFFSPDAKL